MEMNPDDYYNEFVRGNYDDFCSDIKSVRKGFNVALSLSHMTDNYYKYYKKHGDSRVASYPSIGDFKAYLSIRSGYYLDINSIANAYKHLYTNATQAYVTVSSGGAIDVVRVKDDNIDSINGLFFDDESHQYVGYTKKDGTTESLKDALDSVIDMWENIFEADRSMSA